MFIAVHAPRDVVAQSYNCRLQEYLPLLKELWMERVCVLDMDCVQWHTPVHEIWCPLWRWTSKQRSASAKETKI